MASVLWREHLPREGTLRVELIQIESEIYLWLINESKTESRPVEHVEIEVDDTEIKIGELNIVLEAYRTDKEATYEYRIISGLKKIFIGMTDDLVNHRLSMRIFAGEEVYEYSCVYVYELAIEEGSLKECRKATQTMGWIAVFSFDPKTREETAPKKIQPVSREWATIRGCSFCTRQQGDQEILRVRYTSCGRTHERDLKNGKGHTADYGVWFVFFHTLEAAEALTFEEEFP